MDQLTNHERWIIPIDEQIAYLDSLDRFELRVWLTRALTGMSHPIWIGDEDEYERITSIYECSSEPFKEKMKDAVSTLLCSYRLHDRNDEYLYYLIYLAGRLRVADAYPQILSWVSEGGLKGIFVPKNK